MTKRKPRTEAEDNAAFAEEAARLEEAGKIVPETDPAVLESAVLSEAAATIEEEPPPEHAPGELPTAEELVFVPPPPVWTPSESVVPPPWVVSARRIEWRVEMVETPDAEPRARWTGTDIDYRYFKGGTVIATFREGGFGRLETAPVAEFDVDPPAPEPAVDAT